MTNKREPQLEQQQDRFGRRVAAVLTAGTDELPYGITERLRAARVQAVSRQKQVKARGSSPVFASGGSAVFGFRPHEGGLWSRLASVLPLAALAAGLVLINVIQDERRASEVAEVDAALLTDDLPPAAYADPGFVQFLKSNRQ
jgi:hypothetical protein